MLFAPFDLDLATKRKHGKPWLLEDCLCHAILMGHGKFGIVIQIAGSQIGILHYIRPRPELTSGQSFRSPLQEVDEYENEAR